MIDHSIIVRIRGNVQFAGTDARLFAIDFFGPNGPKRIINRANCRVGANGHHAIHDDGTRVYRHGKDIVQTAARGA
jgi:hypothetical protein